MGQGRLPRKAIRCCSCRRVEHQQQPLLPPLEVLAGGGGGGGEARQREGGGRVKGGGWDRWTLACECLSLRRGCWWASLGAVVLISLFIVVYCCWQLGGGMGGDVSRGTPGGGLGAAYLVLVLMFVGRENNGEVRCRGHDRSSQLLRIFFLGLAFTFNNPGVVSCFKRETDISSRPELFLRRYVVALRACAHFVRRLKK